MSSQPFEVGFVHRCYDCAAPEVGDGYDERVNGFFRPKPSAAEQLSSSYADAHVDRMHFDALPAQPREHCGIPRPAPHNFS